MEIGLFTMPSHPPERSLYDGQQWDLQVLRWADELGYKEAWIGEHHTAPWEPHPSPDLLVAQALLQTKNIRLGPGGFLLPYHHPAELANRVAMLDHLAQGRLNFGVAASGLPSDWAMFDVDGFSGQNREMTRESLEIILRLWTEDEPFEYKGKYWNVNKPDRMYETLIPHIKPFQQPHPPIGVAGLSKNSDTLKLAGERGFLPMSLNLNPGYVKSHWDAGGGGRAALRQDAAPLGLAPRPRGVRGRDRRGGLEALRRGHDGPPDVGVLPEAARLVRLHRVPQARSRRPRLRRHAGLLRAAQLADRLAHRPSPRSYATVYEEVGGFGVLLVFGFDYADNPEAWHTSMRLLTEEVLPLCADLVPPEAAVVWPGQPHP